MWRSEFMLDTLYRNVLNDMSLASGISSISPLASSSSTPSPPPPPPPAPPLSSYKIIKSTITPDYPGISAYMTAGSTTINNFLDCQPQLCKKSINQDAVWWPSKVYDELYRLNSPYKCEENCVLRGDLDDDMRRMFFIDSHSYLDDMERIPDNAYFVFSWGFVSTTKGNGAFGPLGSKSSHVSKYFKPIVSGSDGKISTAVLTRFSLPRTHSGKDLAGVGKQFVDEKEVLFAPILIVKKLGMTRFGTTGKKQEMSCCGGVKYECPLDDQDDDVCFKGIVNLEIIDETNVKEDLHRIRQNYLESQKALSQSLDTECGLVLRDKNGKFPIDVEASFKYPAPFIRKCEELRIRAFGEIGVLLKTHSILGEGEDLVYPREIQKLTTRFLNKNT